MIFHPVRKLVEARVREILIVTGTDHMGAVVGLLGSGKDFGCEFTYRVQDEAGGIAQALGLARRFGRGGRLAVILGDNIFGGSIAGFADAFRKQKTGAKILVQEVPDPGRCRRRRDRGRAAWCASSRSREGSAEQAWRSPASTSTTRRCSRWSPASSRRRAASWEITDVNNAYIARGDLTFDTLPGWWTDAGTFESHQASRTSWRRRTDRRFLGGGTASGRRSQPAPARLEEAISSQHGETCLHGPAGTSATAASRGIRAG